jgi:beta-glucosidase/6-phospho-beta-glucosidase/beta-galactosidase
MLGYGQRFGLVEVDRVNQRRTVKSSSAVIGRYRGN